MGIAIRPQGKRGAGAALTRLAASFRDLPIPAIGRVHEGAFVLDLRCLEDEVAFVGSARRARSMIVATAGHIDHGKTLLVKALTGVDTDRLPEEKSRGMTIDLGFAYWPLEGGERVGFVDVPGHERFIRNMLAGVSGIDFVLLVVAADDGVMPQTREHAAILDLLGVSRGAVAITKIDRVTPERVAAVTAEIAALLGDTVLAGASMLPVSAVTRRRHRRAQACARRKRTRRAGQGVSGNFRLAIDRAFTVTGAGLVVTGPVISGSVALGDTVRATGSEKTARVRSIHAQNRAAPAGRAGERCALNLAGSELKLDLVARGDWIVAPFAPGAVARFDARIRILPGETRALAHGTPVHVHLGAAAVTGRDRAARRVLDRAGRVRAGAAWRSTARSARCMATASFCATSPRGARSAAGAWSIYFRRAAAAEAQIAWPISARWKRRSRRRFRRCSRARRAGSTSTPSLRAETLRRGSRRRFSRR